MPKNGVTTAAGRKRKIEEIRATARFGNFPIPADMSPVDILMDELKRSAGFCFWIESKLAELNDELIDLIEHNVDDKGALQSMPSNEREWLLMWQAERKHLATVAKMCLDAGVSERQISLAEKQSELMFMLINEAFSMLGLTAEQQALVPKVMPALVRKLALPAVQGEVVGHADQ
jgi:hypothetical protein